MDLVTPSVEGQGTGGNVELAQYSSGNVQEKRSKCGSTFGNHHRGVHGLRTNTDLVSVHVIILLVNMYFLKKVSNISQYDSINPS